MDGYCECGCGGKTRIAKRSSTRDGMTKGQPLRFIAGHHQSHLPRRRQDPAARFWAKVDKQGPDDCWGWTARLTPDGYGQFREGGKGSRNVRAHRFAYELMIAPIPPGLLVCHTCDNPICCNPAHLFIGTHADNSMDMVRKGRAASLPGELSPHTDLTEAQVREIRAMYATGEFTQKEIGRRFGISGSGVGMIVRRQNWRHVN